MSQYGKEWGGRNQFDVTQEEAKELREQVMSKHKSTNNETSNSESHDDSKSSDSEDSRDDE